MKKNAFTCLLLKKTYFPKGFMSYLPEIISDLALILISAGLVTLIFKRLGQPLVLGYIVAGFMAGPHMPYTPSVTDTSSIQSWADIGVIFLMFTLGLDFSFKKILKMGPKPIFAACMIVFCMMSVGNVAGFLFGWNSMDRLFLGGMLAMSSTTIIYKAFDDLALRSQKFSSEVLSVLVLEDILGILLMVVLSAMAVSRTFEGAQLLGNLLQLSFFLIIWFVVGVYVVPTFLRKSGKWINDETLLIVAIGLCFMLVVMASKAGYSSAFGAFMMGSILAETTEAENVERVVKPLKNLFGAIFFVSVGMLVNPQILMQYWWPILALTLAIIVGQAIFGSISFLLSGQSLRVYAMRLFVDTDWRICLHHCLSRNSPKRDKPIPLSRCGCCFHCHHLLNALHDQGGSSFLQCHLSSYTRTHTRENKQQQKSLTGRAAPSPLAHADRLTSQRCQHLFGAQCGCRSDCFRFSAPLL